MPTKVYLVFKGLFEHYSCDSALLKIDTLRKGQGECGYIESRTCNLF